MKVAGGDERGLRGPAAEFEGVVAGEGGGGVYEVGEGAGVDLLGFGLGWGRGWGRESTGLSAGTCFGVLRGRGRTFLYIWD